MCRRKIYFAAFMIIGSLTILSGCGAPGHVSKQEEEKSGEDRKDEEGNLDYEIQNVELTEEEKEEAIEKLRLLMENCRNLYQESVSGEAGDIMLPEQKVHQMIELAAERGTAVTCESYDYDMQNFEAVAACLREAEKRDVETEFYVINTSGIFRYRHLQFEDGGLFVTTASAVFDENLCPQIQQMEKIRAYSWEYTEKGWLIWEKALSRNQEMDMHIFCRIVPLDKRCRQITEECIRPVSYFCNNLFLEDWDENSLEKIKYNDLFEFLYFMTTGIRLGDTEYSSGVPKDEFEAVICRYFDITPEELEKYAEYEEELGVYPRSAVGCWNRIPQFQPFPEVVSCVEHADGTVTAYVEAVYREAGLDYAFGHAVTLRWEEGRGWVYLSNKIDYENAVHIPDYRARKEYE